MLHLLPIRLVLRVIAALVAVAVVAASYTGWVGQGGTNPQGVPWETFFTYGESTVYGEGSLDKLRSATEAAACCEATCCTPEAINQPAPVTTTTGCCAR